MNTIEKEDTTEKEVEIVATLNMLYTDMDTRRKYISNVIGDVEELGRLNRWCYSVERALKIMGIGVLPR